MEWLAAGSDFISFDAQLCPLPEVGSQPEVARQPQTEVKLSASAAKRRSQVCELSTEERLSQTRRTVTVLVLFAIVIFIYMFLTSLNQSLTCQRAGVLVLVVWVTWLLPAALVWISDIQSRLRCICYCHVTCCKPRRWFHTELRFHNWFSLQHETPIPMLLEVMRQSLCLYLCLTASMLLIALASIFRTQL